MLLTWALTKYSLLSVRWSIWYSSGNIFMDYCSIPISRQNWHFKHWIWERRDLCTLTSALLTCQCLAQSLLRSLNRASWRVPPPTVPERYDTWAQLPVCEMSLRLRQIHSMKSSDIISIDWINSQIVPIRCYYIVVECNLRLKSWL